MIASWMLYCVVVSLLLGLAALSLDHALRRRGPPLRWVWAAALGGSLALGAAPWLGSSAAAPSAPSEGNEVAVAVAADALLRGGASADSPAGPFLDGVLDGGIPAGDAISSLWPLDRYLLPGWALASIAALLLLVDAHRRLGRRRRRWRSQLLDGLPVYVSRDVGPAVVGFLHTAIVVPEWVLALDPERRRLVLAHETEHLRAGDAALLLAALIVLAAMPWNVPLWWHVRRLRHAVELDCDARVLRGTRDAAAYGELLIDVGEQASVRRLGFAAFAESSSFLAARIRNLTAPRPRAGRMLVGACLSAAALSLAVACDAPTPAVLDPDSPEPAAATPVAEGAEAGNAASGNGSAVGGASIPADAGEVDGDSPQSDSAVVAVPIQPAAEPSAAAGAGGEKEVELITRSRPNIPNLRELIRRLHPEVDRDGLPLDRALWFAIDIGGRIRASWVGPNLYVNFEDGVHPQTWWALPEGSPEERRARAEHQRAVQQVLDANVPGMRIRARYAAYTSRPVPITLHFFTEAPGTPAWGGRDTLATEIVIRSRLPISGERLPVLPVETVSWGGVRWNSVNPARIINTSLLERVGEVAGAPIFAEAGVADPEVVYRLEREPNVFLPFRRQP